MPRFLAPVDPTRTGQSLVCVYRIDLDSPALAAANALRCLDAAEQARAQRFLQSRHGHRWRAGRIALRVLLGATMQIDPAQIRFDYGEHGKPFLSAPESQKTPFFNLSHTGGTALLAVTLLAPVGIDIETVRALQDMDDVARRVFSAAEHAQYQSADGPDRVALFYRGWTRKEAVLKARGTGLATPLQAFDVSLAAAGIPQVTACREAWRDGLPWQLADIDAGAGLAAAIALRTETPAQIAMSEFGPDNRADLSTVSALSDA